MEYMNSEEIEILWFEHTNDWFKKSKLYMAGAKEHN